ncbi:hypothetical protein BC937DRAFT_86588 [Endogone sp. FLAS-F59071]|nr:hypothetical protein BC937DRAFT_86588 [Endogone sp. FLAS-F59071]|eukprot:RUS12970.1 hypothetical protein BC937DRAFT_86588 [Endogone sp. FLAS-F59071]
MLEPVQLGGTYAIGEDAQFFDAEFGGHAKGLAAVVEEGEGVDIVLFKGDGERGLVDAVKGAGCQRARLVLVHDVLYDCPALRVARRCPVKCHCQF